MNDKKTISPIAYIHTDYPTKFGIPRQCGLVDNEAYIVFEKEYRSLECVRELDGYSHIWLIWGFSENEGEGWKPTVRPPRLGGNRRVGVFASRSPFRPNGLGLSVVKLLRIDTGAEPGRDRVPASGPSPGQDDMPESDQNHVPVPERVTVPGQVDGKAPGPVPVLYVSGADLMDHTPIYDIKPYMPWSDSIPEALSGYARGAKDKHLDVQCSPELMELIPPGKRKPLFECLALDPRPPYQEDPDRIYGMRYADMDVRFRVENNALHIVEIITV